MFEITPTTCKASHTETNVKVRVKVFPLPQSFADLMRVHPMCEKFMRAYSTRDCEQLDASLLAGANWMSILCLWLTYVSGQTQDLMVARDVLHRRQSNDDHERP